MAAVGSQGGALFLARDIPAEGCYRAALILATDPGPYKRSTAQDPMVAGEGGRF